MLNPDLPQFPVGTQAALVRQMLLLDREGRIATTGVTESVQIRIFRAIPELGPERERRRDTPPEQEFYEFTRSRALLFADKTGGLRPLGQNDKDFRTQLLALPYDEFELQDNVAFEKQMAQSRAELHWLPRQSRGSIPSGATSGETSHAASTTYPTCSENTDADQQGQRSANAQAGTVQLGPAARSMGRPAEEVRNRCRPSLGYGNEGRRLPLDFVT